jgi:hypothetical protein
MKDPGLPSLGISHQWLDYTPVDNVTCCNHDYSHGSRYWSDKSYDHVAPDGTVHPKRYADRRKEREEYENSRNV